MGSVVGCDDGTLVGIPVGCSVGCRDGCPEGQLLGHIEGWLLGCDVGVLWARMANAKSTMAQTGNTVCKCKL